MFKEDHFVFSIHNDKMGIFKKNIDFFKLLAKNKNKNQNLLLLKHLNRTQYNILKRIAKDILQEVIPITKKEFNKLSPHAKFIRKLANNSDKVKNFKSYTYVIQEMIKIALKEHEVYADISFGSNRRMGKDKNKNKCCIRKGKEDSDNTTESSSSSRQSSDGSSTEEEDNSSTSSEEEEEKEEKEVFEQNEE